MIGRAAVGAVIALTAVAAVGVSPAAAVVGGSATADAVDVNVAVSVPPLIISAVGGTAEVVDPPTNGTNSSGASVSVVADALLASAVTSVVDAVATRGPISMVASSDINDTAVTLFGDGVVTAGVIASDVECPLVGPNTASASAVDVTIGAGPAVTLSTTGTTTTTGTAVVSDVLFVGGTATVSVTATAEAAVTATTADAVGLRLTLSFASGTLVAGAVNLAGIALGSVVLAESNCESPTGPDPAPSVILSIVPDSGPTAGGTATTITGSGFLGATGVTFDGVAGTGFTVVDDTTITVTTPPGAAGPADVVVVDAAGDGTLPGGFTYIAPAPSVILSIVPDSGPTAGGTATTITGSGFLGATGVTFDGVAGTGFTVVDDTTITVTTPPGAAGPADVVVVDAAGDGTLPGGFTYIAPAPSVILSIVPDSGPTAGGTATTITGSGFLGATGVTFDGVAGTGFTVVDDTTITVTTPPGAAGPADVVVVDAAGDGTLPGGFTYIAPAPSVILSIVPDSGPTAGGTATTITGSGFLGATGVTFDGVAGTGFTVVDDTTITVTTPPGAAGPADVVVVDAAGDGTLPGGFTYIAPAPSVILSIVPDSGPTAGGTATTITGSGFLGATGVTFDGVAGTGFTVVDDTTITVTTPPGAAGPADVVVVDAAGDGTLPGGFTYTAVAELPATGAETSAMLGAGTFLLLAGLVCLWFARRRQVRTMR